MNLVFIVFVLGFSVTNAMIVKRQNYYQQRPQSNYYSNQPQNYRYNQPYYNNNNNNQGYYRNPNQGYYPNQKYYGNQSYQQNISTTTLTPEQADAQLNQYMDPFVLLGHLPELIQVSQNGSHLIQDVMTNRSLTEAEKVEKIVQWYNGLVDDTEHVSEIEAFKTHYLNISAEIATTAGDILNSQPEAILNAWKQLTTITESFMAEKTTVDSYKQQLNQIYNSIPTNNQNDFKQVFKQIYGYDFTPSTA
uniref:SXP/RAL-2 family protein Ani s 5-like cation-binding domain-containing protein n=1 Tax=Panagrolaimus sp. JU765 TaxID=591449 RepID=A0AC34QUK4_9BILA